MAYMSLFVFGIWPPSTHAPSCGQHGKRLPQEIQNLNILTLEVSNSDLRKLTMNLASTRRYSAINAWSQTKRGSIPKMTMLSK